jgi:hypothetical protein
VRGTQGASVRRMPLRFSLLPGAALLALLPAVACAVDAGDGEGSQNAELAQTVDMAEYVVPVCASGGRTFQIGSEQFRTVPMGMQGSSGRFVIVKSADGSGFEEWSVDATYLRIRTDTTWAYELPDHTWCDVKCGNNDGSNCQQRWNTNPNDPRNGRNPSSPWAYTVYLDAKNPQLAAPWIPRKLQLPMGGSTQFTTHMIIQGARRDTCGACDVNFATKPGQSVGRTVKATRMASWNGFADVVELRVLSGPGAGEVYDYARGKGWVGFNGKFATAELVTNTMPSSSCAGFQPGSICAATGGAAPPPPKPTTTAPPPPAPGGCACSATVDNYCLYAKNTPGCAMTAPGGYCDPNGDGSFADADWIGGYVEYHQKCR